MKVRSLIPLGPLVVLLICLAAPSVAAAGRTVIVPNNGTDDVASFDAAIDGTLSATTGSPYDTGESPVGATFSPDARFAYITNIDDDSISRYGVGPDGTLQSPGATPSGGNQPTGMAFTPDGTRLLVTNRDGTGLAPSVSVFDVDPTNGSLTPVPSSPAGVGIWDPRGVAVSPDGRFAYITGRRGPSGPPPSNADAAIAVVRISGDGSLVPIAGSPFYDTAILGGFGVGLAPDGSRLFIAHPNSDVIAVHDIAPTTGAPTPIAGSPFASGANAPIVLAPTPDGRRLYVVESGGTAVQGFDVNQATGALTNIAGTPEILPGQPQGVAVAPDASFLYTSVAASPGLVRGFGIGTTGDANDDFIEAVYGSFPLMTTQIHADHAPDPSKGRVWAESTLRERGDSEIESAVAA